MNHLKKMPRLVTAAVLSLTLLSSALLCSCSGKPDPNKNQMKESEPFLQQESEFFTELESESLTQQEPVVNLKYGKKYFSPSSINQDNTDIYYIFREDGTGVYHRYEKFELYGEEQLYSYEIQFVYEIVNGKAVCFFDSLKIDPADNNSKTKGMSGWCATMELSNDILLDTGNSIWVCEDFLSRIPNFGK